MGHPPELQFAANDSNHYKFTGKERDTETGLDYFGARYYSNGLGRFITPDWAATPEPVPYADLGDPQSLNQYSYVRNIPTAKVDSDGHCCAPYELANWIDSHVDQAVNQQNNAAVMSGHPALAAAITFNNGVAGDTIKSFTNLLRLGESAGSLPDDSSPTQKVIAAAEEGGRVGGIILVVVGVAGPKGVPAPAGDTLKPGSFAGDGVPASGPRITAAEQRAVNADAANGCHTCGTSDPGTKSGNWVGDHQPPTALNKKGGPQTLYSQCLRCSNRQGGQVTAAKRAAASQPPNNQTPSLPVPATQKRDQ